jgi:hypothetical protein
MCEAVDQKILDELSAIRALIEGREKSQADRADDLLRCALLDLTEITETLGEPNFAPEKILLHCEHLLTLLQGARLVLAGREPTHV